MRLFLLALIIVLAAPGPVQAQPAPEEGTIRALLIRHKTWTLYWEITDAELPGQRAHKLNYQFFERDGQLMARLIVEFGGCEFPVRVRPDGVSLRYCLLEGEPSLKFDAAEEKYPFRQRDNPRKLWLTAADGSVTPSAAD